jgi:DNA-directed RNA polymerase specialized sigma24 family protein
LYPAVPDRTLHPDYELVARIASGETAALSELQARHGRTTYAVAYGILTDPIAAEHAVAEAFREVCRLASGFIPGELTVVAWLTSLARRRAEALAPVH